MDFSALDVGALFTTGRLSGVWVKSGPSRATMAGYSHIWSKVAPSEQVQAFNIPDAMVRTSEVAFGWVRKVRAFLGL